MRLTVPGPTGGTGAEIVRQALAAGHQVTAVARQPQAVTIDSPALAVVSGDVLDPDGPGTGIGGAGADLSALGGRQAKNPVTVYSRGTAAVIAAMEAEGVTRFIEISAAPVAPDQSKPFLEHDVIHALLRHFFGASYEDMRATELLAASPLTWTVFRPPRLTIGRAAGRYRTAADGRLPRSRSVHRPTLPPR